MTNFSLIFGFLFLSTLFMVEFSNYPQIMTSESTFSKDKDLKSHFAKFRIVEEGDYTLGRSSFLFEVTESDSTLFSGSVPRRVNVNSFYISSTEVTNFEWKVFYNDKVQELGTLEAKNLYYPDTTVWATDFPYSYNEPMVKKYFNLDDYDDYPVVGVTWIQAQAYCSWKSKTVNDLLKKKKIEEVVEFRLPTEDEWESAAINRPKSKVSKSASPYCWAEENMFGRLNSLTNIGQVFDSNKVPIKKYADDGYLYTSKVASFPPNDIGLYDMAGNVSEWTSDSGYILSFSEDSKFKKLSTANEVEIEIQAEIQRIQNVDKKGIVDTYPQFVLDKLRNDKRVLAKGDIMICKGGSWASGLVYTQSGIKQGINKNVSSSKIGFRVTLSNVSKKVIKYLPKKKWNPK